jgi:mono/diheme cytochrome c family protein
MRRLWVYLGFATLAAGLGLFLVRPVALPASVLPLHEVDLKNGERMFNAGGCYSCHTSEQKSPGLPELGGGLEMDTPFGVFLVPNISPDPVNGIGRWNLLDFVSAMRAGVSPDGRHYYPAFPYSSYSRMSVEDLVDLKYYLDTLPVVRTPNKAHQLEFPWNIRMGIGLWKLVNLDSSTVTALPADDIQLQLGRYLVEGPGHCGECHTPRNWTGGLDYGRWLAGAKSPEGEGKVPNITPGKKGLAGWSQGDISDYLASGFTPDYDTVGGSMVEVQENMALLPEADRQAIAAYLKAIPPME